MAFISFQPTDFFNPLIWTGDGGASRSITGVGFQPDMVWIKQRDGTNNHMLADAVRGANNKINPNTNAANDTNATSLTAFGADGFTAGTNTEINASGSTYVGWNWKAGTTSGLSGGTITPTAYSINASAGWGIYKYTGGSSTDTIAHGLGVAPKMIIIKSLTTTNDWTVYHESIGNAKLLVLNTTAAESSDATTWNSTSPTSTVWSMGNSGDVNNSARDYIAYAFAPKKGFSSFGSYDGSGQLDGPFIFTGFSPAFVMVKVTDDAVHDWYMWDNRRSPSGGYNEQKYRLMANQSSAEGTSANYIIDMVSNGFKLRDNNVGCNGNGNKFIYMAFAEFPLVSSNSKPGTAR